MTLKRIETYRREACKGKDAKAYCDGMSIGADKQLEADRKDYKILQEHIDYLDTVIESFEIREKIKALEV